ncbi:thioredoxin family protein [Gordoniibacillus kamchatkensis]|uniref:thioredoxin family protein n=1 Tax=Gordoniibacillus kamchatkensis TaxID=1590651 RepID=UPI000696855E|nr:thioredoxin family protein [Paenibacillus sp. VKM B-2647]
MNVPADGKELTGTELKQLAQQSEMRREPLLVMFVTPLCGTCRVALRMLEIAEATDPTVHVYRCNINTAPELAQRWRIASVPALASIVRGEAAHVLYRMESVGRMFSWLQQHRQIEMEGNEHGT